MPRLRLSFTSRPRSPLEEPLTNECSLLEHVSGRNISLIVPLLHAKAQVNLVDANEWPLGCLIYRLLVEAMRRQRPMKHFDSDGNGYRDEGSDDEKEEGHGDSDDNNDKDGDGDGDGDDIKTRHTLRPRQPPKQKRRQYTRSCNSWTCRCYLSNIFFSLVVAGCDILAPWYPQPIHVVTIPQHLSIYRDIQSCAWQIGDVIEVRSYYRLSQPSPRLVLRNGLVHPLPSSLSLSYYRTPFRAAIVTDHGVGYRGQIVIRVCFFDQLHRAFQDLTAGTANHHLTDMESYPSYAQWLQDQNFSLLGTMRLETEWISANSSRLSKAPSEWRWYHDTQHRYPHASALRLSQFEILTRLGCWSLVEAVLHAIRVVRPRVQAICEEIHKLPRVLWILTLDYCYFPWSRDAIRLPFESCYCLCYPRVVAD